jgi:hypothetical protein
VRGARIGWLVACLGAIGLAILALIAGVIWLGDLLDVARATL